MSGRREATQTKPLRTIIGNTPFDALNSVVYVKVNVTGFVSGNPQSAACAFSPPPATPPAFPDNVPDNIDDLYATAAGPLPLSSSQSGLDICLAEWCFTSGQFAAIAFNLSPESDGTYNYAFNGVSSGGFNPRQAIFDGEPLISACTMSWIQDDGFDGAGQTVVVVCPVTDPDSDSEIPYTLEVVKTDIVSGASTCLIIDPKVKNAGAHA